MQSATRGLIVTAAFIGPGTVTTASLAGATLGYQLVWALVFSIFATSILQVMTHRLGVFGGIGLSEASLQLTNNRLIKLFISGLIISGIVIGNAAYEGGNITGAALGLQNAVGGTTTHWSLIIGVIGTILLVFKNHSLIEKSLVFLVVIMSLVFISVMIIAGVDVGAVAKGINPVNTDFSNITIILAIIGTTIVPYNLFLLAGLSSQSKSSESSSAANDLKRSEDLKQSEWPLIATIGVGGLITFAIMSSAATAFFATGISMDSSNIGSQLEPVLGAHAETFFAFGLFAAGLSSALTAPLAAGYAVAGILGWKNSLEDKRFQGLCLFILLFGVLIASSGFKPITLIVFAQAANAVLLPVIAILLILVCNRKTIVGEQVNSAPMNIAASIVILVIILLSVRKLFF